MTQSICFVLDFEGDLHLDSGLDLYYQELIHLLVNHGWDVSVVYFPSTEKNHKLFPLYLNTDIKNTVHLYEAERLCGESKNYVKDMVNYHEISWKSHIVHEALQVLLTTYGIKFDIIEFLDSHALACIPLRMDKSFRAYNESKIIVKLAKPYPVATTLKRKEWYTLYDLLLEDVEHYSFDHADFQLSVSQGYTEFLEKEGWKMKSHVTVCPFPIQKFIIEYQGTKALRDDIIFYYPFAMTDRSRKLIEQVVQMKESNSILQDSRLIIVERNESKNHFLRRESYHYSKGPIESISEPTFWNYLKENRPRLIVSPFDYQKSSEFSYLYYLCLLKFMELQVPILTTNSPYLETLLGTDIHQIQDIILQENEDWKVIRQKLLSVLQKDPLKYNPRFFNGLIGEDRIPALYEAVRLQSKHPAISPPQKEPDITIVVPYYNAGQYIEKSLDSLKNQSFKNSKIIIVNDGSTDPVSLQMLETIKQEDENILVLNKENGGIGSAMNCALKEVTSKYIIEFDADNIATPFMIERFVTAMENRDDVVGLSAYAKGFRNDEEGKVIQEIDQNIYILKKHILFFGTTFLSLFYDNTCGDATAILRTETIKLVGGWPEDKRGYQDWPLWLKLLGKGHYLDVIPEALYYYRWRAESDTAEKDTYGIDAANMPYILDVLGKDNNFQYIYPKLHRVVRGAFPVSEIRNLNGVYDLLRIIQIALGKNKSIKKLVKFFLGKR